ncbi:MAG: hypothetical protein LBJ63_02895 [Prevotellaceae bacterium]|jgi:hypothetical protein|nr:hypothetical protein [Prevotellaceae bacterium]
MKRSGFLESIGFRFIANHRTGEIHRVDSLHVNCNIEAMTRAGYCTWLWHKILLRRGYNGCYWCNREENEE